MSRIDGDGVASLAKVEARLLTPRPPLWPKGQGTGLTVAARPYLEEQYGRRVRERYV